MIDGLTPYPSYKDSRLPWLGEVPAHWNLPPNRALMRKRKVLVGDRHPNYQLLSLTKQGVIVRDTESGKGKFSADMGTCQEVRTGDLIFCLFDVPETPRTVGLSRHDGMITGAYTVFECSDKLLSRFLDLFYRAMDDRKLLSPLYSGLRNTIPPPRFLGTKTPVPPPDEQAAIVRFLDHVDRRIRRYIRAKRQLITLLGEQKQAIIHRAVTRGLDPGVRLKPTGMEWLGDVPEHWEIKRAKYFYDEVDERSSTGSEELMSVSHKTGVTPRKKNVTMFLAESNVGHKVCRPGDLAINTTWAYMAALGVARQLGIVSPSYGVYRPHAPERLNPDYIDCLLRTEGYKAEYLCRSTGITSSRLRLYPEAFLRIPIMCPPLSEQAAIVKHLKDATAGVQTIIDRTQHEIDLLHEYRTRLIADVVTGKLDVREVAARLPEDVEEAEAEDLLLDDDDIAEDAELDTEPEEVEA